MGFVDGIVKNLFPDKTKRLREAKIMEDSRNLLDELYHKVSILPASKPVEYVEGRSFVLLPSDHYIEVAPGIHDRVVTGPENVLFDFEKEFISQIPESMFEDYIVVLVKFSKVDESMVTRGAEGYEELWPHRHDTEEIIIVFVGKVYMRQFGDIGPKEERNQIKIPAFVVHDFIPRTDGFAVVGLKT